MTDYIIGVDLGQSADYSALGVLRRCWRKNDMYDVVNQNVAMWKLYHEVPMLVRWPLGTPYPQIVEDIEREYHYVESVSEMGVKLVVDQGGPGRPVMDMLRERNLHPIGVTITAALNVNVKNDSELTCPKRDICSALVVAAQSGDIKIAADLDLANELQREIESFGYTINRKTGQMTYESIVDEVHDDLVLAVAMGLWYSTIRLPRTFPFTGAEAPDEPYRPLKKR